MVAINIILYANECCCLDSVLDNASFAVYQWALITDA